MSRRAHGSPTGRLIAGLAIVLAVASVTLQVPRLGFVNHSAILAFVPTARPQSESEPARVAHDFAVKFNAIDYRDKAIWLESLRPTATDRGFAILQAVYMPLSWTIFEREKRVVPEDWIIASDLGPLAQGDDWQVRLVAVEIAGPSTASDTSSFEMRILLKRENRAWKFDSLMSQSEVEAILKAKTTEGQ